MFSNCELYRVLKLENQIRQTMKTLDIVKNAIRMSIKQRI